MIYRFSSAAKLIALAAANEPLQSLIEGYITEQDEFQGYCPITDRVEQFRHIRPTPGEWSDMRERIMCECGVNGRMRMLYGAIANELHSYNRQCEVLVFEQVTPFYRLLVDRFSSSVIIGCEYVGPEFSSGQIAETPHGMLRHEDMSQSSLAENSMDLVFHADVLEHVAGWQQALSDSLRILRPGGVFIFSTPCFDIPKHRYRSIALPRRQYCGSTAPILPRKSSFLPRQLGFRRFFTLACR